MAGSGVRSRWSRDFGTLSPPLARLSRRLSAQLLTSFARLYTSPIRRPAAHLSRRISPASIHRLSAQLLTPLAASHPAWSAGRSRTVRRPGPAPGSCPACE